MHEEVSSSSASVSEQVNCLQSFNSSWCRRCWCPPREPQQQQLPLAPRTQAGGKHQRQHAGRRAGLLHAEAGATDRTWSLGLVTVGPAALSVLVLLLLQAAMRKVQHSDDRVPTRSRQSHRRRSHVE